MITFVIPSTKWRTYLDQFIGPGDLIENLGKSLILAISGSGDIALRWITVDLTDGQSTLVQVMNGWQCKPYENQR